MGQGPVTKKELKELRTDTKGRLTKKDIERYHKFWFELYPAGEVDKQGFVNFAKMALPEWNGESDVDYLFRAMDQDRSGTITFKEFLMFQSITAPSNNDIEPAELIELAFSMYDGDGDGYVTIDELRDSLKNMYKAKGIDVSSRDIKEQIETRINKLLEAADKNNDGQLTKEEIINATKNNPALLQLF
ncbi:hypothetical protein ABK040_011888 [Willaertia magna]